MKQISGITQTNVSSALANPQTDAKIKLRAINRDNLEKNVWGESKESLKVVPFNDTQLMNEEYRPINIRSEKVESIRRFSDVDRIESTEGKEVPINPTAQDFMTQNVPSNIAPSFNNQEIEKKDYNIENIVDISEYVERLNNAAEELKVIKDQAVIAQQEAIESDKSISRLSVEVSELEKQEIARKRQSEELDREVIEAYRNQERTLEQIRNKYKDIIQESKLKKQNNEHIISQFQSRIDTLGKNITEINESIARKQGILPAIRQLGFVDDLTLLNENNIDQYQEEEAARVKRVA